ncbi:MAG: hypothetical protein PHO62_07880 [Sulfurimonas sp.]|uniref:hypothetical protein n=1 Tax=Sulfurimonas sp. TaxID=2022749 RepID=UPI0026286085|nr:hypothetical protein [Sulfurimonas sp.]MDD5373326.1 hypothetical protein [Sulfurimonas sp.]
MKKILLSAVLVSLAFGEVIDKDNILNQLKELQKAKAELSRSANSPEALREKEDEKLRAKNIVKVGHLKKMVGSLSSLASDEIIIPAGKFSQTDINGKKSFFIFEQDLQNAIYQNRELRQRSQKIRLLEKQINFLSEDALPSDIQKVVMDMEQLLQFGSGNSFMSGTTSTNSTQKPLIELREDGIYKGYKIHGNENGIVLEPIGTVG